MSTSTTVADRPLAERVDVREVGACRLLVLPTPALSIVSFRGSFNAFPDFAAGEELIQDLAVSLLDKGTRSRDRFAVADVLETRGAQLQFYADGLRIGFAGRALRDDLPDVLDVLAEQLREPLFDPDEFAKGRAQLAASLQRALENTGRQAAGALTRRLYGPGHPSYTHDPAAALRELEHLTPEAVSAFHAAHFGADDLIVTLVGDIDRDRAEAVIRSRLGDWPSHGAAPRFDAVAAPQPPGRTAIPMPDKQNVDVYLGHALRLRRDDADYLPLFVAAYVLGGNFSARLMNTVRDEMGLTYGIRASLAGVSTEHDGYWRVGVTLSGENLDRGTEATLSEVRRFVEGGITTDELDDKQTTITGSFLVGLATTGGLAASLQANAERGFDVGYLDAYPDLVRALDVAEVNGAIARHFDLAQLQFALAGEGVAAATEG